MAPRPHHRLCFRLPRSWSTAAHCYSKQPHQSHKKASDSNVGDMAFNSTYSTAAYAKAICTERPVAPLFFSIPDKFMVVILPVIAYWSLSLLFHFLDEGDYFKKYKLHTPEEFLKRNRVTVHEVIKEVLIQHFLQTVVGLALAWHEPGTTTGCEHQAVLGWASWISAFISRSLLNLSIIGFDSSQLSEYCSDDLAVQSGSTEVPSRAVLLAAQVVYWLLIPFLQYTLAAFIVDTWQYLLHRAMHMSPYLYRTLHSRHHRLYVPYAFGALYNHPLEGFLLDSVGSAIAFKLSRMDVRQGMWFFTLTTFKTVNDHSGYRLPWNPVHWVTDNNANYHDIHHQSWGLKSNFSQPFSSFWDRALGTMWTESQEQTNVRYERGKTNAQAVKKGQ